MAKENIKQLVAKELEDFLAAMDCQLYDVKFVKEAKDWFLRVYIEKTPKEPEAYISVEDCEKTSRFLSDRLDETDPIQQNYYLEVSSPGLDREFLKEEDYRRFAGKQIEVKLYQTIDGKKQIEGVLEGIADRVITVRDQQEKKWKLPLDQIAKANLAVVF